MSRKVHSELDGFLCPEPADYAPSYIQDITNTSYIYPWEVMGVHIVIRSNLLKLKQEA